MNLRIFTMLCTRGLRSKSRASASRSSSTAATGSPTASKSASWRSYPVRGSESLDFTSFSPLGHDACRAHLGSRRMSPAPLLEQILELLGFGGPFLCVGDHLAEHVAYHRVPLPALVPRDVGDAGR